MADGPGRDSRLGPLQAALTLGLAAVCLACGLLLGGVRAEGQGGGLKLRELASFDMPVHIEDAPGKPKLLFVVEQAGVVRVLRNGRPLKRPFLDLRDRVKLSYEEGMLSIAFDPDYERNRRFFLYYVNGAGDIEVDSFKHKRGSTTRAASSSRRKLIEVGHPGEANHNGGQLQFGPDGFLYLGTGDGGGSGDPDDSAQDPNSLLGKLLRIDPNRRRGYSSPESNPFAAGPGRDEVYALGLRNPYRFSFDAASGDLTIGDVGQSRWEEIDHLGRDAARGANFGWNLLEGNHDFNGDVSNPPPGYVPPIHEYTGGCSVIGGYVVRDATLPALAGRYLYADHCGGLIRSLDPNAPAPTETDASTGLDVEHLSSFGEGARDRIYVTSLDGPVYRIVQ